MSGLREEGAEQAPSVNDTDLSLLPLEPEARINDTELSIRSSGPNPDTLMSLPKPLPHDELPSETRIRQLEDRIETLERRLDEVQRGSLGLGPQRSTPWWFWLLFLAGLAATWRVLGLLR